MIRESMPAIDPKNPCLTKEHMPYFRHMNEGIPMTKMFFEPDLPTAMDIYNVTLIVTKTVHLSAARTTESRQQYLDTFATGSNKLRTVKTFPLFSRDNPSDRT